MKIYIIDDDFTHQGYIYKQIRDSRVLEGYEFVLPDPTRLNKFYKDLNYLEISDSDIFIVDIDLKLFYSGIDFAQLIRNINFECDILFITSDVTKATETINLGISPSGYISKEKIFDNTLKEYLNDLLISLKKKDNNIMQKKIKLSISSGKHINYVYLSEINYIETEKGHRNFCRIILKDRELTVNTKLGYFKNEITTDSFFKDLKSFIINTNNIEMINKQENSILFTNLDLLYLGKKSFKKIQKYIEKND